MDGTWNVPTTLTLVGCVRLVAFRLKLVSNHDWLATVLHQFGLDHHELKFRVGTRNLALVENPAAVVVDKILRTG